jgi:uroporphyrinogen decarboxylase
MNGKERILLTLNGEKPDRVPIFDFLEGKRIFKKVLNKTIANPNGKDITECSMKIGLDAAFIAYGGFCYSSNSKIGDTYIDEWGVGYKNTGNSWPIDAPYSHPVKKIEELGKWLKKTPDPYIPDRLDDVKQAIGKAKSEIAIFGGVIGPLTTAMLIFGFETLLLNLQIDPFMIEEVFKISCNFYNIAAKKMIEAGVDAIFVCEDLGFKTGIFASPDIYRRHLFPYLFDQIDKINKNKIPVLFHSDGNINEITDDLVGAGITALHPIERKSSMDLSSIRKRYGNNLCLIGNINASTTLVNGSSEEIEKEVKEAINTAGKEGAYILASDSDYHDGIPPENFIHMIDTGKKFGKYY